MSHVTAKQLKNILLFQDLPEHALAALAQKTTERVYSSGGMLMRKGDVGDSLFLILEGMVKIVSEKKPGEELILNRCGPGEAIGEMSLLDSGPRSASVIATAQTRALELKQADFLDLLHQRPELALAVIRSTSSRLRFATTYIERAIDWSKRVAAGDYSATMDELQGSQSTDGKAPSDAVKANQLLSAFFQMVQGVKAREDQLKQEVRKLTLEIDEARRKQQVQEVTGTEFYANLKSQAARMRQEREQSGQ